MFFETHDGEDLVETRLDNSLEAVRNDVSVVQKEFNDCLKEDDMGYEELKSLNQLLSTDRGASYEELAREGDALLGKVQEKLKTAAEDLQRIDDESNTISNASERRADRLTKAATVIMQARERLHEIASA
jgi:hypothetical protein